MSIFKVICTKVIKWRFTGSVSPGESVTVTVCSTEEETAALLASVLDGDKTAASLLAQAIHQDPATIDANTDGLAVPLSPSELGIWIDPIGERLDVVLWLRNWFLWRVEPEWELFVPCFSWRCNQPVHRRPRGGAGGGTPVSFRSALCFGSDRGLSPQHRRAGHGRHQPAVQLQGPSRWTVSEDRKRISSSPLSFWQG